MSSENLDHPDRDLFLWSGGQDQQDYVLATYRISTPVAGEQAALGIAREQSICATHLNDVEFPTDIENFCAKVIAVQEISDAAAEVAQLYFLNTPVYGSREATNTLRQFKIVIAYPVILFGTSPTRLWNSVFGEVHRLGYLSAATLVDLKLPTAMADAFPGPRYGIDGIREKLQVNDRPIFCRSMRPASGLSTEAMLQLNERVLSGGFDVIKDDELTYDSARSPFADRVHRMAQMKRSVEDATGEPKLYFANIIDDFATSLTMAEQAQENGADGVLVSASAQGLSFITEIAKRTDLIILSHNSCGDALTRSGLWGASDGVMATMQRVSGADLVVSPGPFATAYQDDDINDGYLRACSDKLGNNARTLPIIQGGKQPEYIAQYTEDVGSVDYMIIAATWIDNHPKGIQAGAAAFRDAWDTLKQQEKIA